ncbi:NXPE family member 3-like [Asterias amurensis]|uniref:NXPE family member 3-like n=1 Tax=Asterias amurensis TaxID=7602 RepID=UPI003AB33261
MIGFLAKMEDQVEAVTSLSRKSRFVILVLLCICVSVLYINYTESKKPTVRSLDDLKRLWNIGQHRHDDVIDQTHKSPPTITSAKSSSYRILDSSGLVFQKGSTLRLVIEARDLAGTRTTRGGDMWFATVNSLNPKASTSGNVVDNGDGTYLVQFYAGWVGVAKIDIILAHPKEACDFVEERVWPAEDRQVWSGVFRVQDGKKLKTTKTTCLLQRNGTKWDNTCEYWYPAEMGDTTLVCGKPEDKNTWSCDDLYSLGVMKARVDLTASELIQGKEYLFEKANVMQIVEQGPKHIKIDGTQDVRSVSLPPCQPDLPDQTSEGFWFKDKWHSLRCRNTPWHNPTVDHIAQCFKGKSVFFLGDTTARQLFEAFHEAIGLKFLLRSDDAHYRFIRHHSSLNLSVVYQARPLLTTSSQVPIGETRFETDILNNLKDQKCNSVILLSPSSHTFLDRMNFLEMVKFLKGAITDLLARCPKTPIAVRGPHPGVHGTFTSSVYGNNIILRDIRDILKETLQGTGVFFLDSWDINVAYPSPNHVVLPVDVAKQEVALFMSYVCKDFS